MIPLTWLWGGDGLQRSFPTGVFSSMDMWLSDFLIHLEQQTLYPGEHPMARQLERM